MIWPIGLILLGYVEPVSSVNLCILPTQSRQHVKKLSQEALYDQTGNILACEPRFPKQPTVKLVKHEQAKLSTERKQKQNEKKAKEEKCSEKEIAKKINRNVEWIKSKLQAIDAITTHKRKAIAMEKEGIKKRRIIMSKYKLKRGKKPGKPRFLVFFSGGGGPEGVVHTHEWRTVI